MNIRTCQCCCLENATLSRISSFRSLIWCELLISRGYRGNRRIKYTETTIWRDINCNQKIILVWQVPKTFRFEICTAVSSDNSKFIYIIHNTIQCMIHVICGFLICILILIILRTYFLFIVCNMYKLATIKNMTKSLTLNIYWNSENRNFTGEKVINFCTISRFCKNFIMSLTFYSEQGKILVIF